MNLENITNQSSNTISQIADSLQVTASQAPEYVQADTTGAIIYLAIVATAAHLCNRYGLFDISNDRPKK